MTSPEPPHPPKEPEVPVWVPLLALLAVLFIVITFSSAVFGVLSASDPSVDDPEDMPVGVQQALTFFQHAMFIFVAWLAIRVTLGRVPREQLGLRVPTSMKDVLVWSAIAWGIFWVVLIVLAQIFGEPGDQPLVEDLKAEDALSVLIPWAVLVCLVAPIAEELFFRGFMFTVLLRKLGLVWAVLLDGAIFGLGHVGGEPIQLIALGALGCGLCLLYWRTQSIIPCMALHALNNSVTFGVTKELDPALLAATVVLSVGSVAAIGRALASRRPVTA